MLSLRAISECQHFCPTPALPLRYFLNAAFVMCGALVRAGLYLARPDGSTGYCEDFFITMFISMLVLPSLFLLVVHMYRTPAHACYEIFSLPSAAAVSFYDAAAWILTRLAGTFPVSHMGSFCIFLSQSRTNTDNTNINTHTHTQSDMHTNTFPNLLKDRLWCAVFCLWRFHCFFDASPSSAVTCVSPTTLCSATETPVNTVSSNLNVPVLQSHFQLCFNGCC